MKVCIFTESCIYATLQQIYIQFCLDLINVLLLRTETIQELLFVSPSFRFQSFPCMNVVILVIISISRIIRYNLLYNQVWLKNFDKNIQKLKDGLFTWSQKIFCINTIFFYNQDRSVRPQDLPKLSEEFSYILC